MGLKIEHGKMYWTEGAQLVEALIDQPGAYMRMMLRRLDGLRAPYQINCTTGRAMVNDNDGGRVLDIVVQAELHLPIVIGQDYMDGSGRRVRAQKPNEQFEGCCVVSWNDGKSHAHVHLETGRVSGSSTSRYDLVADAPVTTVPAGSLRHWFGLDQACQFVSLSPEGYGEYRLAVAGADPRDITTVYSLELAQCTINLPGGPVVSGTISIPAEQVEDEADARAVSPHKGHTLTEGELRRQTDNFSTEKLESVEVKRGHPYAAEMMQYAEDAQHLAEPWRGWECKYLQHTAAEQHWRPCEAQPNWDSNWLWRRKPSVPMETLGVQEYPTPMLEFPGGQTVFFYPCIDADESRRSHSTAGLSVNRVVQLLERGLLHDNPEAAGWHAKALMTLTTKMWKDAQ